MRRGCDWRRVGKVQHPLLRCRAYFYFVRRRDFVSVSVGDGVQADGMVRGWRNVYVSRDSSRRLCLCMGERRSRLGAAQAVRRAVKRRSRNFELRIKNYEYTFGSHCFIKAWIIWNYQSFRTIKQGKEILS